MCYIKVPIKSSKTTYQCIYTHTHAISRFFINGLYQACWSLISFLQLIKCPHFLIPFTSFFKRLFLSMLSHFYFQSFPERVNNFRQKIKQSLLNIFLIPINFLKLIRHTSLFEVGLFCITVKKLFCLKVLLNLFGLFHFLFFFSYILMYIGALQF